MSRPIYRATFLAVAAALVLSACQAPSPSLKSSSLSQRWSNLRSEQPRLGIRDAASRLQVSEAELLSTTVGVTATRLQDGPDAARGIMRGVLDLGEVMALTRNENGVIEVTGVPRKFDNPEVLNESTGDPEKDRERAQRRRNFVNGFVGGPINLRLNFDRWATAFAVSQPGRDGSVSRSLQFFDSHGTAVHKVYLRNTEGVVVFDQLVVQFRNPQQSATLKITAVPAQKTAKPDSAVDVKELQQAWGEMEDVHQFGRLLTEFGVSREQALRLAPAGMAEQIAPAAVQKLLSDAAARHIPFMAFLGNESATQIFSGTIEKTEATGEWFNVLDPQFNLHLRESALQRGWVVKRGNIHSVEFFDKEGHLVVTFFGVRERGQPQTAQWTQLLQSLTRSSS